MQLNLPPSRIRQAAVALQASATLGEGACWDADKKVLYWVDILECEVHIFDPNLRTDSVIQLNQPVSFVQPTKNDNIVLVGTKIGVGTLNLESGELKIHASPESDSPGNRFNDGKVGPDGKLYAGTIPLEPAFEKANLWRFESDFSFQKLLTGVTNSNGLCWSPDQQVFYYIDTGLRRVDAFDFDRVRGDICNRRTVWFAPESLGKPDGMTCDAEGCLWIAMWGGGMVIRIHPHTGELLEAVTAPCKNVTCPTFGGEDFRRLYFTTAKKGRPSAAADDSPHAGDIFFAEVETSGLAGFRFHL